MFKQIDVSSLSFNPFEKIGKEWLLITAGNPERFNTMTASWGGLGVMWGSPLATTYIRPQRYTKEFVDSNDTFTISFFDESYKKSLQFCGTHSGRDVDKAKEANLTPVKIENSMTFEEASLVLVCQKQYVQEMKKECFLDKQAMEKWYPENDYHFMYMAKIIAAFESN